MFLSRGDRDLGVAFQTHPGRQAFISGGDLVVLSRSHLRTGWQWGNRIPEVLFSVPV